MLKSCAELGTFPEEELDLYGTGELREVRNCPRIKNNLFLTPKTVLCSPSPGIPGIRASCLQPRQFTQQHRIIDRNQRQQSPLQSLTPPCQGHSSAPPGCKISQGRLLHRFPSQLPRVPNYLHHFTPASCTARPSDAPHPHRQGGS